MSIVEAYLDLLSSDTFRQRVPSRDSLTLKLIEAVEARTSATWDERKEAFNAYHGVALGDVVGWDQVASSIPVRNSIAHGLGRLTPMQDVRKTVASVTKVGVRVVERAVVIDDAALKACRDSCVAFVRGIDEALD